MKKIKQLLRFRFVAPLVFLVLVFAFVINGVVFADNTPTGVAYCELETGVTYQCGPGTGGPTLDGLGTNNCTVLPIIDTNNNQISATCGGLFQFTAGKCYVEGLNPNGGDSFYLQKDCSADGFSIVQPKTDPMPQDITSTNPDTDFSKCQANTNECDIVATYINPIISFLSILVGIVIVISVVLGGIQYSASADNPQAVAAARKRIINAVLAGVAFLFLWGFLEFIVPGGFFNGS
jgi:hypothetical protein